MRIFNNLDKPVYQLRVRRDYDTNQLVPYKIETVKTNDISVLEPDPREISTIGNKGTLNKNSVLFFDKSAVFPRYKLQDTELKRCIKQDKADLIVIGNLKSFVTRSWLYDVYENDNSFLISSDTSYINYVNSLNEGYNLIYSGRMCVYNDKSMMLLYHPSKPYITDTELDEYVNKSLPTITLDDIHQIEAMLSSSDFSVVDLGLKLINGFNVTKTPLTIIALLCKNENWRGSNAINSVGVQTLLNSINFKQIYLKFPMNICSIAGTRNYSDEDVELCKEYIMSEIKEFIFSNIKNTTDAFEKAPFNFKIKVTIE